MAVFVVRRPIADQRREVPAWFQERMLQRARKMQPEVEQILRI